jgi:hypothetical protein
MANRSVDAPATEDAILTLSTQVEPADHVKIDGETYDMLGFAHLSDEDEAQVVAMLARYDNLSMQLVTTNDDKEAVNVARKLRRKRIDLLTKLTTIPESIITKLPPPEQIKLVKAVQRVASDGEADGDDES